MNSKIKRLFTIALIVAGVICLVGFGKKAVDLLNSSLLIDLDKAIVLSSIGNEGNVDSSDVSSSETHNEPAIIPTEARTYIVTIRDTQIKYGKMIAADASKLKEFLVRDIKSGDTIRLVDDYAEAHVYKDVLGLLDEMAANEGIKYSEY